MEELIQSIINTLTEREQKTLILSAKETFSDSQRGTKDFLYNKQIKITHVGALLLKKVAEQDDHEPWVRFIYAAFDYGCEVYLKISFEHPFLIAPQLLMNHPIHLINKQEKEYKACSHKVLTYKDVALLMNNHILLLRDDQQLTALAKERLQEHKILCMEGRSFVC